jgi:hypothetical protein
MCNFFKILVLLSCICFSDIEAYLYITFCQNTDPHLADMLKLIYAKSQVFEII